MKHLIASICIMLLFSSVGIAEIPVLKKDSHLRVQVIPEGEDFHDDGANLTRYPAYTICTIEGEHVLNIPESINNPHVIEILPGTYKVKFKRHGKTLIALLEVDSDSFQRFRL